MLEQNSSIQVSGIFSFFEKYYVFALQMSRHQFNTLLWLNLTLALNHP